jgi:SAM-dependent methyltransferase
MGGIVYSSPLSFLGPLGGRRILICGAGLEAVVFALAGADVYGFDRSTCRVEAVKDLARRLGLRDRARFQTADMSVLAYPDGFFDLAFGKTVLDQEGLAAGISELVRVMKRGGRAAFVVPSGHSMATAVRRAFGSAVLGECWIGVEKDGSEDWQSHWSDSNRRPLDYESRALPLSYSGGTSDALARIRTATPFGTTPSR